MRFILAFLCLSLPALAQQSPEDTPALPEQGMTLDRMALILQALDPDARFLGNGFELTVADVPVLVIADVRADRMRALVPIASEDGLTPKDYARMMQANFDSALDARYAVANGKVWGVFIHPLSPLEKDQLISGIAQTVNIAQTYGGLYTGGAMQFGGGDSPGLQRQLLEKLLKKGEEL